MKDIIIVCILLSVTMGCLMWLSQPRLTVEELQARAELKRAEAEARALIVHEQEQAEEREREESHRRQMELEAIKTPEERVVEAKEQNSVDVGEAVLGVAGIGAAAYLFSQMLDY